MPAEESGSGTNMWTSFDYGNAHFISIDTETDYDHAPEGVDTIFKAGMCTVGSDPLPCGFVRVGVDHGVLLSQAGLATSLRG